MRIAAFNVENLFDRVKAFDQQHEASSAPVLEAFHKLNKLFEKAAYSPSDKAAMLALMEFLHIVKTDEGPFVWLRRIRGKLIVRPRQGEPYIAASGRADWVGWCELKLSPVNEIAIENTARVIAEVNADILALVEVESRPVLTEFHDFIFSPLANGDYRHLMVIDGNDDRGIDVGLMTKAGFPIDSMRSHVDEEYAQGKRTFSRDCPEYFVRTPGGETLVVLPNHFKSKYGGNSPDSRRKREAQAAAVAAYYGRLLAEGYENIVVLGDLNDTPQSQELGPLLSTTLREVTDHPGFTEFEFNANSGGRGIGTFGAGSDGNKIDYLLLSPALWDKVDRGGIFRKGCWTASGRWEMFPTLSDERYAASDHHAIWVDLNF